MFFIYISGALKINADMQYRAQVWTNRNEFDLYHLYLHHQNGKTCRPKIVQVCTPWRLGIKRMVLLFIKNSSHVHARGLFDLV